MENKWTKNIFSKIIIIVMIIIGIIAYRKYDFNFFVKGVISSSGKTSFLRDNQIKTSKTRSYKIKNSEFNDAVFYKEINVKKYTPYKVTCMIKTENVEQLKEDDLAGAQIILQGTEEHSQVISNTTEWKKVEFYFNSKNSDTAKVGFRLGGNGKQAKGTAWFSDLQIEEGFLKEENTWDFACFIFENIDAKLDNGRDVVENMTKSEIYNITETMKRLKTTTKVLSKNKMQMEYEIIEITEPITTMTYDDYNGYYISESDVYNLIKDYTQEKEYDHIFACVKLPNEESITINNVVDWVGLGNMQYCGKGFSDIRITTDTASTLYKYSSKNTFPEEVFLHEFLHTLERNAKEYGYDTVELHNNEKYGYFESSTDGLRNWYKDYMNREIYDEGNYIGLPEEIFKYKPINSKDFTYSIKLDSLDEPSNIIETIQSIAKRVNNIFRKREITIPIKGVSE